MPRVGVLLLLALAVTAVVSGVALAEHAPHGTPNAVRDVPDDTAADSDLNPLSGVLQDDDDEDDDDDDEEGREDDEEEDDDDDDVDEPEDEEEREDDDDDDDGGEKEREDEDEDDESERHGKSGRNGNNGEGNNGRSGNSGNGQQGAAGQDDRGDDESDDGDEESEGEENVAETEDSETGGSDSDDENWTAGDETSEQDVTNDQDEKGADDGEGEGGAGDADDGSQDDGDTTASLPSSVNWSASATPTAPPGEAAFSVPTATLGKTSMTAGENVRVRLRVENTGEREGSYEAVLRVDGASVATESVTVEPGGTETIVFNYQVDELGEYEISVGEQSLGTLTVTDPRADGAVTTPDTESGRVSGPGTVEVIEATTTDDWVREGYETTVRATVVNTANRTVARALTVTVDGQPVANRSVTLRPDERDVVTIAFDAVDGAVAVEGVDAGRIAVGERFGGARTWTDEAAEGTDLWVEFGLAVFVGVLVAAGALGLRKE